MSFAIVGFLAAYIIIFIVVMTTVSIITKKSKIRRIAFWILILIPTWDVILGYPVYKLLCWTKAGAHIYKTVDNIEGFYVGEKESGSSPVLKPYDGYMFIDYKETENGKYYRNHWIDSNTSELCIPFKGGYDYDYTQAFKQGRCIAKEEIPESMVSRYRYLLDIYDRQTISNILEIHETHYARIIDRNTNELIGETTDVVFGAGWLWGILSPIESGHRHWSSCMEHDLSYADKMLKKTLKPKEGEK